MPEAPTGGVWGLLVPRPLHGPRSSTSNRQAAPRPGTMPSKSMTKPSFSAATCSTEEGARTANCDTTAAHFARPFISGIYRTQTANIAQPVRYLRVFAPDSLGPASEPSILALQARNQRVARTLHIPPRPVHLPCSTCPSLRPSPSDPSSLLSFPIPCAGHETPAPACQPPA